MTPDQFHISLEEDDDEQEEEQQQQQPNESFAVGMEAMAFQGSPSPSVMPWQFSPVAGDPHYINQSFMTSRYGLVGLYDRRAVQFAYDGGGGPFSSSAGLYGMVGSTSGFGLQAELQRMTAQEIMDAKALAASKSHSEAELRRRERINTHLARLRSLLPSTTKTDKASLLAEVIQHVKELKRQTSQIAEESPVPTESDELTVDAAQEDDGRFVIKASLCCEDRSDLMSDLIKALKSLRMKTIKADLTTLGGRVRSVLVVSPEEDNDMLQHTIVSVQEAFRAVMERTAGDELGSSGGAKRQRITNMGLLEQRSI
ncbi:Transcription factor bHLH30 [Acorus calamus]|uniref:Transcription factor bHLH30 n=1 Tax=Acorus calamus TaxID=4465 RepID=A0AAV9C8N1_ACOCL|nr:Transcription factor bHLH30 [Acorus calamus]